MINGAVDVGNNTYNYDTPAEATITGWPGYGQVSECVSVCVCVCVSVRASVSVLRKMLMSGV